VIPTLDLTEMRGKSYNKILNEDCIASRLALKTGKTISLIVSEIGGKNLRLYINPQRITK